jgi:hypothetical protein
MEASLRSSASVSFTLGDLKSQPTSRDAVLRSSAVSVKFSILARFDYLRGPKEIDEKLMRSETPTAGTLPRSMHPKHGALT